MKSSQLTLPRWAWFGLAALLLVLIVAFWVTDLDADPPMYFSGLSQSLSTDPANLVFHARNHILFGAWDPYDYGRWTVFQHSLVSFVGWFWMSLTEPSLANGNMAGMLLTLGGLLLLVIVLWRRHSPWTLSALILFFGLNSVLYVYGRLSYLETGVIFLAAFTFLAYVLWGKKIWGLALAGALAAATMLLGKLFGTLLLPVILLAVWSESPPDKWRRMMVAVGGFAVTAILLIIVLYAGEWRAAFGYVAEQSYGLRGFPEALTSPLLFIEKIITYGVVNRIYERSPDLLFMLVISGVLLAFFWGQGGKLRELPRTAVFALWWIVVCWLGFSLLNYSPTRYALTFLPAIPVLVLALLDWLISNRKTLKPPTRLVNFIPILLVLWIVAANLIGNLFLYDVQPAPIARMTWFGLLFAVAVSAAWLLINQKLPYTVSASTGKIAAAVIVVLTVGSQGLFQAAIGSTENYSIKSASVDVARILDDDAVLSGPYGSVLGMENELKTFIHQFGLGSVDPDLFNRYPITHIAAETNNWQLAQRNYPELEEVEPIASYFIRDIEIGIYPIYDRFANQQAQSYEPTLFEQAVKRYQNDMADSAFALISRFEEQEPLTKMGGPLYVTMLYGQDKGEEVINYLGRLGARYPTDFSIQLRCGQMTQILALANQRQDLMMQAQTYYNRAAAVNPHRAAMIAATYRSTIQQFGAPRPPQSTP